MTKADLIDRVASVGLTKKKAAEAIDAMIDGIKDALKREERVQLIGFGSFSVRRRAAREGRNPQTRTLIRIPAKKVPVFRPGEALKNLVK